MNLKLSVFMGLILLPGLACKSVSTGSGTKDIQSTEQDKDVFGNSYIVGYFSDSRAIYRANCPAGTPMFSRTTCPTITHTSDITSFSDKVKENYEQKVGVFDATVKANFDAIMNAIANNSQTFSPPVGAQDIMDQFLQASLDANPPSGAKPPSPPPGNNNNNNGGTPLPSGSNGALFNPTNVTTGGLGNAEISISVTNPRGFSRIRTQLQNNCGFNIRRIVSNPSRTIFSGLSVAGSNPAVWASASAVQTNEFIVSFSGSARTTCSFQMFDESSGNNNGSTAKFPEYVMNIMSFENGLFSFLAPNQTHTFAIFAKLNTNTGDFLDYVPMSWLPIAVDANGIPQLANGQYQIGAIKTLQGNPRPGWAFSIGRTIAPLIQSRKPVTPAGIYAITPAFFNAAKAWREEMNTNANANAFVTRGASNTRFLYVADDRQIFKGCRFGAKPDAMNCFHAVVALNDESVLQGCLESGPLSGVAATNMVIQRFRASGMLGPQPFSMDPNMINANITAALAFEAKMGNFDTPARN